MCNHKFSQPHSLDIENVPDRIMIIQMMHSCNNNSCFSMFAHFLSVFIPLHPLSESSVLAKYVAKDFDSS